ncbi:DUF359 domain-containing protein [Thermogladius sp. 4427co]|uniref:DUF359 domain-containing protein n=1 Tax=Thermogladius sp. 4427co TaxID=3450718 RepID=UPI003F7A10E5
MRLPVLRLPGEFLNSLKIPQGTLFVTEVEGRPVRNISVDASVGDIVSTTLVQRLKILDGRTRRGDAYIMDLKPDIEIVNPRGSISIFAITLLRAVRKGVVLVNGEEDLLAAAVAWNSPDEWTIAYGQPNVGVVVITASKERLLKFVKILKPAIAVYNP